MRPLSELDEQRLDQFERDLLSRGVVRVASPDLWRALASVFPHRSTGPAERRLMLEALKALESRGSVRLPSDRGKRWDRSMDPAVPTSIDVIHVQVPSDGSWRTFPWHPNLDWVAGCRTLSAQQVDFLRRVHDGFVNGTFRELVPLKYRSLQLTGDEKMLAAFANSSLFGPSRLTLEALACLPDALPLVWEPIGEGSRVVIFENAGPFAVARRVLGEIAERPYDLIAYGGGRSVLAALGHLKTIRPSVESIHYVGDLDHAGLDIAWALRSRSGDLELPPVQPASELHRQMLSSAKAFGYPEGWPAQERCSDDHRSKILDVLTPDVRGHVDAILRHGRRIPEEVLGPRELANAWSAR